MTDTERARIKAICEVANIKDIGELSDGFHTFNSLYEQRMILFAALVKAYKDMAWKSYRHEDGEYCFGGGWFIVGIDTPEGSYTYHYENKYWDMFDCVDLPRAPHWDGHTEADAETRLMSLQPVTHTELTKSEAYGLAGFIDLNIFSAIRNDVDFDSFQCLRNICKAYEKLCEISGFVGLTDAARPPKEPEGE